MFTRAIVVVLTAATALAAPAAEAQQVFAGSPVILKARLVRAFHLVGTVRLTDRGCAGTLCTVQELPQLPLLPVWCGQAADPPLPPGRCAGKGTLNGMVDHGVTPGLGGTVEFRDLTLLFDEQPAFVPGTIMP